VAGIQDFEAARRRAGALNRLPPRLLPIEVRKVVGSVTATKVAMLTREFVPRDGGVRAPRFRAVYTAMQKDIPLPPIEVYALRGKYYVVDGHNRVAAARALDYLYLDALVHEFLLPATSDENRLDNERMHFERTTGLTDIVVTETGHYRKLLSQVREHRFFLGEAGQSVNTKEAAAEWHEYVYSPIAERLEGAGVLGRFPDRALADVYVYLCDYKWVRSQNKGMDIGFPKAMADFERLYPPVTGAAAGLATLRHALHSIATPVTRSERERIQGVEDVDDGKREGSVTLCPSCAQPVGDDDVACPTCHYTSKAV